MEDLLKTLVSFIDVTVLSTVVAGFIAGWLVKQPEWVQNLVNSIVEKFKSK